MTNRKFAVRTAAATFFVSTLAASGGAFAQDADADAGVLEEIVITAQKRESTLLETPIAVSAFSGDTLSAASIRDIRDLQVLVPSYNVTQSQSSFQTVASIRAIGSSSQNPGIEPSVGIYVDGVFRSRTGAAAGDFMSVERIEVLRGPQSTLFGKNTSAGVISIITQKPQYEAGGSAELTYGNYDQIVAKATVTGPLVEDKLAVRLSGNYNKRDGYVTNLFDGSDVNDRDRYSLRGQLLFEPSDAVSIRLIADYAEADERCCVAPFSVNGPTSAALAALGGTVLGTIGGAGDIFARNVSFDGELRGQHKDFGFSGQVDWDLGAATVTSITAYRDFESDTEIDADFGDLSIIARNGDLTKVETFTQEFRITSNGTNKVDWLVGGYYFNQDLSADGKVVFGDDTRPFFGLLTGAFDDPLFPGGPSFAQAFGVDAFVSAIYGPVATNLDTMELLSGNAPGTFFASGEGQVSEFFTNDSKSWALFGQVDLHLGDRMTLTAGLRYTDEKKGGTGVFNIQDPLAAIDLDALAAFLGAPAGSFDAFKPLQFLPPVQDFDRDRDENKFTGNVILAYDVNDNVNTYASFSRGYKAGGFDISRAASTVGGTGGTFEFDEETVNNIEVGLKARVLDGRGRINIALYRQKVKDFQSVLFVGTGFELRNAGDIKLKGIEIDAEFSPTDNFYFTLAAAYNDAKYGSFINGPCPIALEQIGQFVCDLSGARLNDAPKLTFTGTATLTQPVTDSLTGFLRGEIYSRGGRFTDSDNDPNNFQDSSFLLNASFGLTMDDQWSLVFWGKNLTKDNYAQIIFDVPIQAGSFGGYPNDPRTYGVTVRGSF